MRGPVKKESKEERRQRRRENVEAKGKIATVAVPILLGGAVQIGRASCRERL